MSPLQVLRVREREPIPKEPELRPEMIFRRKRKSRVDVVEIEKFD